MTTQELRNKAADYIEAHGHAKGCYETNDGRVCLIGALRICAFGTTNTRAADAADWSFYLLTRHELEREIGGETAEWNDAPERTKEEVIARLRGK